MNPSPEQKYCCFRLYSAAQINWETLGDLPEDGPGGRRSGQRLGLSLPQRSPQDISRFVTTWELPREAGSQASSRNPSQSVLRQEPRRCVHIAAGKQLCRTTSNCQHWCISPALPACWGASQKCPSPPAVLRCHAAGGGVSVPRPLSPHLAVSELWVQALPQESAQWPPTGAFPPPHHFPMSTPIPCSSPVNGLLSQGALEETHAVRAGPSGEVVYDLRTQG